MRIARAIIFAILCIAIGYGIGRFGPQRSEEIEDLAISNLLEQLGYAHYLTSSDTKNIKELVDTNIHANLNLLRMHHGAVSDPAFIAAEIRTLQAISIYWQKILRSRRSITNPILPMPSGSMSGIKIRRKTCHSFGNICVYFTSSFF